MNGDTINALFEGIGALLVWYNVRVLLRDKIIKGVSWSVQAFFASWGLWNLYYYPSLGQWHSFYAGIVLVSGNLIWVAMAIYYVRRNNQSPGQ